MSREAMKQALEALELLAKWENPLTTWQVRKPKDGGPIVTIYPHKVATDAATLLRERLAQPEQEPFCFHDGRNIVDKEFADHSDVFPLYTCPQAREPLTDEQFNRIPELYVIPPHHVEMVVRAIEAAHGIKEKNHG
jgi:hypothetical protein